MRAIQEYNGIQNIECWIYTVKEICQLFKKYLDEPLYQKIELLMQTCLETLQYDKVTLLLQVPGLVNTIFQQMLLISDDKDNNSYDSITKLSSIMSDTILSTQNVDSIDFN